MGDLKEYGGGVAYGIDDLGELATLKIDTNVFSIPVILKTSYWHTDKFYIYLSFDEASNAIQLELRPKESNSSVSLEDACRDISNSLIDYQVREKVIEETGELRDIILRKAFGEGLKYKEPELITKQNKELPGDGDNYTADPKDIGSLTS